jgi:hypothetical protein
MSKQIDVFLTRFAQLEKLAAREARADESRGLMANVRQAKVRSPVIRRNVSDIELLSKLRNVLVHERDARYGTRYLAEPLPELVVQLENIIQQIEKPARVIQHFQAQVDEFGLDDSWWKYCVFWRSRTSRKRSYGLRILCES